MELILRESIDNLGRAGEVVTVKSGYARNYLLPRKLAYLATPGNMKVIAQERQKMTRREAQRRDEAEQLRDRMSQVELTFVRRVGEHQALYGSVTSIDIAEALEGHGYTLDRRKIALEDHIKKLGDYVVSIRLFPEVTAEVKLRVVAQGAEASAPVGKEDTAGPKSGPESPAAEPDTASE
jgi:large subunit ribosomal protein L9